MHIVRGRAGFERLEPLPFADSSPEEAWLRRNTRFLLESVQVAALGGMSLLYGIVVNLFLVAGVLLFAAWWLGWFFGVSGGLTAWNTADASAAQYQGAWTWITWTALLPAVAMGTFVAADAADRLVHVSRGLRTAARIVSVLILALGAGAILVLFAVPWLLVVLHNYAAHSGSAAARLITAAGLVPRDLCDQLLSTGDACGSSGGPSVVGASLFSFASILAAIVAVLHQVRRFLPDVASQPSDAGWMRRFVDRALVRLLPWTAVGVISLAVVTLLLRWATALVADPSLLGHWAWFYIVGVAFLVLRVSTDVNRTSLHPFYRERLSKAFVLERAADDVIRPVDYGERLRFSEFRPPEHRGPQLIACASANVSDNDVVPADRNCVPFNFGHLTTGLAGGLFPAEARTMSRLFEFQADPQFRVATIPAAMAISGAAFSPLAGRFTRRMAPYRVVMALANARLGVWLPNPLWIENGRVFRRLVELRLEHEVRGYVGELGEVLAGTDLDLDRLSFRDLVWLNSLELGEPAATLVVDSLPVHLPLPDVATVERPRARDVVRIWLKSVLDRPGASWLAREAFGKTSVYDRFLYVTDGGHYDNLGLVEALRHRPKEVYVLDASSDPQDSFSTLGQAIATARMDLGCEVELDPRQLRRRKAKPPLVSYGTGRVRYPDGEGADLYYVKALVTRKLPWDVEAYAQEHASFPRTPTTSQLYGEFDLEAYRVLGREGIRALLEVVASGASSGSITTSSNGLAGESALHASVGTVAGNDPGDGESR